MTPNRQDGGRILVVDDEPDICNLVALCLRGGGFETLIAHSGAEMWRQLEGCAVDLMVLDLMLAGEDGLALLAEVRRRQATLPVIILTAMGAPDERAFGLESGADDYVPKPFEPRELLARVRTVLRRAPAAPGRAEEPAEGGLRRFCGWRLDTSVRRLTAPDGSEVSLTSTEFALLDILSARPNQTLERARLFELAHGRPAPLHDRSVDVHVSHLRRKLEADPQQPRLIKTVHGIGYTFAAEVETG